MKWPRILTTGVYGSTEDQFFGRLAESGVDLFCDVRARRGLRGAQYAFANSRRLQERLRELGIGYVHLKDLAPTQAMRQAQWDEDAVSGEGKRSRTRLGQAFVRGYRQERLSDFDARRFLREVAGGAEAIVLFCVEQSPTACHRSLIAAAIGEQLGITVEHLG